jgi:hypothetical protein
MIFFFDIETNHRIYIIAQKQTTRKLCGLFVWQSIVSTACHPWKSRLSKDKPQFVSYGFNQ